MEDEERDAPGERPPRAWYRVAFVATAMLLVAIIVTLPFSLASVVDDVLGPATGKVSPLMPISSAAGRPGDAGEVADAPRRGLCTTLQGRADEFRHPTR